MGHIWIFERERERERASNIWAWDFDWDPIYHDQMGGPPSNCWLSWPTDQYKISQDKPTSATRFDYNFPSHSSEVVLQHLGWCTVGPIDWPFLWPVFSCVRICFSIPGYGPTKHSPNPAESKPRLPGPFTPNNLSHKPKNDGILDKMYNHGCSRKGCPCLAQTI